MTTSRQIRRRVLPHPVETACTFALGAAGQLLLTWALGKAAQRAERDDLHPAL